jgi:hypothetical protein
MAKTDTEATPIRKGDKVTATRDLRGIPEGATGRVTVVDGLTWSRYWVKWDTGRWQGSVSAADLVRSKDWEAFKRRRAEEALRPKVTTPEPSATAESADAAPAAGGASSRVPAHLLERSKRARERKATAG